MPDCRDCADSDGFCCNDPKGPNCGFLKGHPLYREEPFRHANALGRLRQAIIDNTKGGLFWIGEILLAELEKETGFRG